ncbi:MAG: Spy/CpxP family protein refolding chaperone [Myxococcota bacterium]
MNGERRTRSAVLVLALTFLAGAGTGAGVYASLRPRHPHHERGALPPHFEELGLSAEQRTQAIAIMERYRPRFDAIFAETGPRVRALREEIDAELNPLLTEAQRAKLEELRRSRPPRPPPGAPPPP